MRNIGALAVALVLAHAGVSKAHPITLDGSDADWIATAPIGFNVARVQRDASGRERFHPFAPGHMLTIRPPAKGQHDWYYDYNKEWGVLPGTMCCAPDSVSFHYLKKPAMVRHVHKLLYDRCPHR